LVGFDQTVHAQSNEYRRNCGSRFRINQRPAVWFRYAGRAGADYLPALHQ
jgi:hypothetical protein